jgi:hypothetical protein
MWSRQAARAAGASLIAPLVLLLAAGVVASGGGLGGLGSLGQIASGPSLPDTGLRTASSPSVGSAEIVAAAGPAARGAPRSAAPTGDLASATPAARAAAPSAAPSVRAELRSRAERATEPTPPTQRREGVLVGDTSPAPPPGGPVDELQETTQGLGESLVEPLRPVTNQLLDLLRLLVPPPR